MRGNDLLNETAAVSVDVGTIPLFNVTKAQAGTGYVKKTWLRNEIKPGMGIIKVKNPNKTIVWGTVPLRYFYFLCFPHFVLSPPPHIVGANIFCVSCYSQLLKYSKKCSNPKFCVLIFCVSFSLCRTNDFEKTEFILALLLNNPEDFEQKSPSNVMAVDNFLCTLNRKIVSISDVKADGKGAIWDEKGPPKNVIFMMVSNAERPIVRFWRDPLPPMSVRTIPDIGHTICHILRTKLSIKVVLSFAP
jgi:hypothetical protein